MFVGKKPTQSSLPVENVQKDEASLARIRKLHNLLEALQPRLEMGPESCHDVCDTGKVTWPAAGSRTWEADFD